MQDAYQILGVAPSASDDEIKRAWREHARKHHPDINPEDSEAEVRFRKIRAAYETLTDRDARAALDRERSLRAVRPQPRRVKTKRVEPDDTESVGEMLGGLFGKAWRKATRKAGRDVSYSLTIDLEDAVEGFETELELKLVRVCPGCDGKGKVAGGSCKECDGIGAIKGPLRVPVAVPPGVENGQRIKHKGLGEPGRAGGGAGDLYVTVTIRPHTIFAVEGKNIRAEVPISLELAALGGELEVPTLDGEVRMKVPPGTQPGKVFRLRERGLPGKGKGKRGDQYVHLEIEIPVQLNPTQKAALQTFQEALTPENQPRRADFQQRMTARDTDE